MNYDVNNENISVRNPEFEGCHEIPLDIDFSLPDYCPDIQRILKCHVCPNVTVRNISGDRLNIEGVANIRVIYSDAENMKIRCCENTVPFSASIDIKSAPENAVALTHARTEYMNCRAVSPRKIDIHGALSICAKIYTKSFKKITSSVSGKDIQQKVETTQCSSLTSVGQQQFSISEILESDENMPNPEMIIRSDVDLILNDYKTMPNKIVVKGNAIIKILYTGDISSGSTERAEYTIPISQIVDVPGAEENSKFVITGEVLSHEEQIRSEGEKSVISADIRISATVMAYSDKEIGIVSDVYSTDYDLNTESSEINLKKLLGTFSNGISHKDSVQISGNTISEIVDVWSDSYSLTPAFDGDTPIFKGKVNICILALDAEKVPFYLERIIEFNHPNTFDDMPPESETESNAVITSVGYSLPNSNTIDLKIDFDISGAVYTPQNHKMIISAETDESARLITNDGASLIVYYANPNESLWDIAKKYHTSINAVKQENDISEEKTSQKGMLLIPVKK